MTATTKPSRRRRSLTARPWFPSALALWFAALFGLTSLVVPPALLERFVVAIGLDRVFAAAAPPLGETARLLIAVAASAVGEIVGLLVGRALARKPETVAAEAADESEAAWPPPERRAHERRFEAPRRPLFASEDLVLAEPEEAPAEPEAREDEPRPAADGSEPVAPLAPLSPLAAAPLEDLGPAQLTERLALALTARKDRGQGLPAGAGNRLGTLAGLERARLGGLTAEAQQDLADEDEDEDEEGTDESSYSSLLNIGPHRAAARLAEPEADEIDEGADEAEESEPVAVLRTAQSEVEDTDETDRALKSALDSLQRFSGSR